MAVYFFHLFIMNKENRDSKNAPIWSFTLHGVSAKVFKFDGTDGSVYKIAFARWYKGKDGWSRTNFFSQDDLPLVSVLADKAFDFVANIPTENGNVVADLVTTSDIQSFESDTDTVDALPQEAIAE